jgi:cytidyltransferase-like protein
MIKVCTSGYFNPLHKGHVKLLQEAKALGNYLVVIVNNDIQVGLKGSKRFMDEQERCEIVKALRCVDEVVLSIDTDRTVCETIKLIKPDIFAKGGDSTPDNVPEKDLVPAIVYNVGGDKIQSSSTLKNAL